MERWLMRSGTPERTGAVNFQGTPCPAKPAGRGGPTLCWRVPVSVAALLSTVWHPADAQRAVTVDQTTVCAECRVHFSLAFRLGAESDPAGFGPLVQLAVDGQRRFAVSSNTFVGELLLYDSTGKFERAVGRRGGGPGEFQMPVQLTFGVGDSLHAVELGGSRYTVFTPQMQLARSVLLPGRVFAFAIDPRGRILASAPTAAHGGLRALQLLSPAGEPLASFDDQSAEDVGRGSERRFVAFGPDGRMWSVGLRRYEVRSWGRDGEWLATYRGDRGWLSTDPLPLRLDPTAERPPGEISGLAVDDEGLVWIFASVAAADWRPMERGAGPPKPSSLYDTIVEVFEPRSGSLIAWARSDRLVFPLGSRMVYGVVSDAQGDNQIHVWNMSLPTRY